MFSPLNLHNTSTYSPALSWRYNSVSHIVCSPQYSCHTTQTLFTVVKECTTGNRVDLKIKKKILKINFVSKPASTIGYLHANMDNSKMYMVVWVVYACQMASVSVFGKLKWLTQEVSLKMEIAVIFIFWLFGFGYILVSHLVSSHHQMPSAAQPVH